MFENSKDAKVSSEFRVCNLQMLLLYCHYINIVNIFTYQTEKKLYMQLRKYTDTCLRLLKFGFLKESFAATCWNPES